MKKISPVIIFLLLFIGMAIFPYIPMTIFQIDISNLSQKMKIAYSFACDIGFMIIVLLVYKERIISEFRKYFKDFRNNFKISLKYYFIGLAIMIISNNAITTFFSGANANNEESIRNLIQLYPTYMFFSVAIYAPIVEETIFRRSIRDCFRKFKNNVFTKHLCIIVSGLLFSIMHILGQTSSFIDYIYIIPYMALGCAFASLYYKTDNLWNVIILHALHNTMAMLLFLWLGV